MLRFGGFATLNFTGILYSFYKKYSWNFRKCCILLWYRPCGVKMSLLDYFRLQRSRSLPTLEVHYQTEFPLLQLCQPILKSEQC